MAGRFEKIFDVRTQSNVLVYIDPNGVIGNFGDARWHPHPPRDLSLPVNDSPQTLGNLLSDQNPIAIKTTPLWKLLTDAKNSPDKTLEEREYAHGLLDKMGIIADAMRDIRYELPGDKTDTYLVGIDPNAPATSLSTLLRDRGRINTAVQIPRSYPASRNEADRQERYVKYVRACTKQDLEGVLSSLKVVQKKLSSALGPDELRDRAISHFEEDEVYNAKRKRELAPRMRYHESRVAAARNMFWETRYWPSVVRDPALMKRNPVKNFGIDIAKGVFVCCGERVGSIPGCLIDRHSPTNAQSQRAGFSERTAGMTGRQWLGSYVRGTAFLDAEWYADLHDQIVAQIASIDANAMDAAFAGGTVEQAFAALGALNLSKLMHLFRLVSQYNAYRQEAEEKPGTSLEWARFIAKNVFGMSIPLTVREPEGKYVGHGFDPRVLFQIVPGPGPAVPVVVVVAPGPGPAVPVVVVAPSPGPAVPVVVVAPGPGPTVPVVPPGSGPGPAVPVVAPGPVGVPPGPAVVVAPGSTVPVVAPAAVSPGPAVVPPVTVVAPPGPAVPVVAPGPAPVLSALEIKTVEDSGALVKDIYSQIVAVQTKAANLSGSSSTLVKTRERIDELVKRGKELEEKTGITAGSMSGEKNIGSLTPAGLTGYVKEVTQNITSAMDALEEAEKLFLAEETYGQFLLDVDRRATDLKQRLGSAQTKATAAQADPTLNKAAADSGATVLTLISLVEKSQKKAATSGANTSALDRQSVLDDLTRYEAEEKVVSQEIDALGTIKKAAPSTPVPVPVATVEDPSNKAAELAARSKRGAKEEPKAEVKPVAPPAGPITRLRSPPANYFSTEGSIQSEGTAALTRIKTIFEQLDKKQEIALPDGQVAKLWSDDGKTFNWATLTKAAIHPFWNVLRGFKTENAEGFGQEKDLVQLAKESNQFSENQFAYLFGDHTKPDNASPAVKLGVIRKYDAARPKFVAPVTWDAIDSTETPKLSDGHVFPPRSGNAKDVYEKTLWFLPGNDLAAHLGVMGRAWATFIVLLVEVGREDVATAKDFDAAVKGSERIKRAMENVEKAIRNSASGRIQLYTGERVSGSVTEDDVAKRLQLDVINAEFEFLAGPISPEHALAEKLAQIGALSDAERDVMAVSRSAPKLRQLAVRLQNFEKNQLYVDSDQKGNPTAIKFARLNEFLLSPFLAFLSRSRLKFLPDDSNVLEKLRLANKEGELYRSARSYYDGFSINFGDMTLQEQIDLLHAWGRLAALMEKEQSSQRITQIEIDALVPKTEPIANSAKSWFDWA